MAPVALDGLRFVMSDFERALSEWRSQEACKSSLSPCELDELEDHLRVRIELELELDSSRSPSEAFALACAEVGDLGALSREFARAGAIRCRRLLSAGWALFGASFFLPLWTEATWPYLGDPQHLSGLQAFSLFLAERGPGYYSVPRLTTSAIGSSGSSPALPQWRWVWATGRGSRLSPALRPGCGCVQGNARQWTRW